MTADMAEKGRTWPATVGFGRSGTHEREFSAFSGFQGRIHSHLCFAADARHLQWHPSEVLNALRARDPPCVVFPVPREQMRVRNKVFLPRLHCLGPPEAFQNQHARMVGPAG